VKQAEKVIQNQQKIRKHNIIITADSARFCLQSVMEILLCQKNSCPVEMPVLIVGNKNKKNLPRVFHVYMMTLLCYVLRHAGLLKRPFY